MSVSPVRGAELAFGGLSNVSYRIEDHLLVIVAEQQYTTGELRRVWADAVASPTWSEVRGVLLDVRRSGSLLQRPVAQLRATTGYFAMELTKYDLPCVLLVDGAVRYGLMRMTTAWLPQGVRVRVFRDEGGALRWLATMRAASG